MVEPIKMKLAVMGASGRMGQELFHLIQKDPHLIQVAGIATKPAHLQGVKLFSHIDQVDPQSIDMMIDFSSQDCFASLISWCKKHQVKFVSGTTGLSDKDFVSLKEASQKIACLWAPNMSLGINLIAEIIPFLKVLSDYDFQIVEAHHRHKKDKPSGTAHLLQNQMKTKLSSRMPDILSLRGGGIFGIHEIWCMGEEEQIKISHTALNSKVFARGAIVAARWLVHQKVGLYSMKDVLSSLQTLNP